MRSLSWRSILNIITLALFALAIVFWILTLIGWLITEPGFEPLNVLAAALISSLGGLLTLLRARTARDTFIIPMTKPQFERKLEKFVLGFQQSPPGTSKPLKSDWRVLRRRRTEQERNLLHPQMEPEYKDWEYITNPAEADAIKLTCDPFRGLVLELTEKEAGLWVVIDPEGDKESVTVAEDSVFRHIGYEHIAINPDGHRALSAWLRSLEEPPRTLRPPQTRSGSGRSWRRGGLPTLAEADADEPTSVSDKLASLRRQLNGKEKSSLLVEERIAEFVISTDVPLQLVGEKRQLLESIEDLKRRIKELERSASGELE